MCGVQCTLTVWVIRNLILNWIKLLMLLARKNMVSILKDIYSIQSLSFFSKNTFCSVFHEALPLIIMFDKDFRKRISCICMTLSNCKCLLHEETWCTFNFTMPNRKPVSVILLLYFKITTSYLFIFSSNIMCLFSQKRICFPCHHYFTC